MLDDVASAASLQDGEAGGSTRTAAVCPTAPSGLALSRISDDGATLTWLASTGVTGYEVRLDGGPESDSSGALEHEFTSLTEGVQHTLSVRAVNHVSESAWQSVTFTPSALSLSATLTPTTCETGGEVSLSWSLSGGMAPYAVTVDGVSPSSDPLMIACQDMAGTQTIAVSASDASTPPLSATVTLKLEVTEPVPGPAVNLRLAARYLADGRIEVKLELDSVEIEPAERFIDAATGNGGQWYDSAESTATIEGATWSIGHISVRENDAVCPPYVTVTVLAADGTRTVPLQNRLRHGGADIGDWYWSEEFSITLPAEARGVAGASATMQTGTAAAGRLGGELEAGALAANVGSAVDCPVEPSNPSVCGVTDETATLPWSVADGASDYQLSLDQQTIVDTVSGLSYEFTLLDANTDYTLSVRARNNLGTSDWVSADTTTLMETRVPPTVRIRLAAQYRSDGKAEFKLDLDGHGEIEPPLRTIVVETANPGVWTVSSEVAAMIDGDDWTIGRIAARLIDSVCPPFFEVTLVRADGTRQAPSRHRLLHATVNIDTWFWSEWISFQLADDAGGTSRAPGEAEMQADTATLRSSHEGQLQVGQLLTSIGSSVDCPLQPDGLDVEMTTDSAATLIWQAADGATSYEARVGPSGSAAPVSGLSYRFSSLTAGDRA